MAEGRSGIARLTQFDVEQFEVQIGGEVKRLPPGRSDPDEGLAPHGPERPVRRRLRARGRRRRGLVIDDTNRDDVGVIFGSAGGGYGWLLQQNAIFLKSGYRRVSPFLISNMLPDAASGQVAITHRRLRPEHGRSSPACSTGTGAIGEAWETIRRGDAEAMIAGGTDNPLLPLLLAGFHALRAPCQRQRASGTREQALRARRDGFVVGRAPAHWCLRASITRGRAAREIYAEVIGYAIDATTPTTWSRRSRAGGLRPWR